MTTSAALELVKERMVEANRRSTTYGPGEIRDLMLEIYSLLTDSDSSTDTTETETVSQ